VLAVGAAAVVVPWSQLAWKGHGDDALVRRIGEAFAGDVLWFGKDRRHHVSGENWRGTAFGGRFDLVIGGLKTDVALPLPGPHFMMNFLAAAAVAWLVSPARTSSVTKG